ncbi:MAG: 4-(cytidine 5'-diphospho)-2-C-methyl-D-erythritol kinase [Tannerellaceae bacterium]|jgi:4-diphosphocytidyl-2-C-methyl-D-erythritol kinase|nr:4-(cytidine 5'-diphospho)-2-C-methyl-D-erythritol kinase [Tannerellaceae bacterium]
MICFPNAKINLGLNVLGRREDGYHDIETVFYPIPLCDALEVVEAEAFSFSQTGLALDSPPEDNLAVKALRLVSEAFPLPPLAVHLHKAIPSGAGLGGGSSDAAFMLKLLNELGKLHLSANELERMASRLGADCPFFIRNAPVVASGTGNIFEPLDLSLASLHLCLLTPVGISVSTAKAYSALAPRLPSVPLGEVIRLPIQAWRQRLTNDFEPTIFAQHPPLAVLKESLYASGALYASMSGSGSSLFGLFEKPAPIKKITPHPAGVRWVGMG